MIRRLPLLLLLAACGEDGGVCEESPQALVQQTSATVIAGDRSLSVEVADSGEELTRGLQHRRCDFSGLLLVNPHPGSALPIWCCEVVQPLDLAFVRDGVVVEVAEDVAPCAAPCDRCPIFGEGVGVDAVLETQAGTFPLAVGDPLALR